MSRPPKEGMDYFPHDCDASNDEKIEAMTALFGAKGYTFYFVLLERIYRTNNQELSVMDEDLFPVLASKCFCTVEEFKRMLALSLKVGCFENEAYVDRKVLTSAGIRKRFAIVGAKRAKMRIKRSDEKVCAEFVPSLCDTNSTQIPKVKERKVKESKEKKIKQLPEKLRYGEHVLLTSDEYEKLIVKLNSEDRLKRAIDILDNYIGSSGKKYKSHYHTVLGWVTNELEKREKSNASTSKVKSTASSGRYSGFDADKYASLRDIPDGQTQ